MNKNTRNTIIGASIFAVAFSFVGGIAVGTQWQTAVAPEPVPAVVPCATEDAPGPCFWDAEVQGNGQGYSFYVDGTGVYYFAPEDALDFLEPSTIPTVLTQR